jgi:hypothetical protein
MSHSMVDFEVLFRTNWQYLPQWRWISWLRNKSKLKFAVFFMR